jgi:hypothetical protein
MAAFYSLITYQNCSNKYIISAHPAVVVMSDSTLTTYLRENPRMTGVLFTIMLLLSQAGNAAAAAGCANPGP